MPIRHRSDFKQELSTLRQLKDNEDAAHHNQRWTQSYSSSWWNWQESWWHSSYENHHEDVPSTDWSGQPDKEVIGALIRGMIFRIHLLCYSWIDYSWRRSTVADGRCKHYTSNAVRIQWKYMWKVATRNEWDELQYQNKENQDRKLNDTDANDDGDNNATVHFTACVALHNWARARSPVPCTFSSHSH